MEYRIPFNKPFLVGRELDSIAQAVALGNLAGDGRFTQACCRLLEQRLGINRVLLTPSCTAALEMAALLCDLEPGDEVILPSFTFVSTASAFVRAGARPVFVDIRADTLNLDEKLIEAAVNERTKVIVPVHYAGVACEMDRIREIARAHRLLVVEDAAQAVNSFYRGKALGSLGDVGCYSFHETKNFISGEGERCASIAPTWSNGPRSFATKGRTGRNSSAARSTNTPGSTSAPPTCRANSSARFSSVSSK